MDIISFNEASTANDRINKINANPDSTSGIVTVPKVIEAGESVTVPAGRVALLPNVQVDGEIVVEGDGEIFIPAGSKLNKLTDGDQTVAGVTTFLESPIVPTPTAGNQAVNKDYIDNKYSGFKNYIINGGFDIDQYQRGAQSNWNSGSYYIDRFIILNSSSVVRNGAGANNPKDTGLHNHLSITKTAGADTQITQTWEIPKDKAKQFLNGRTLTFSCWVLAVTANFVESLYFIKNGTSANSYEVKNFNITKNNVAGIWTRVTGTITNIQWTYEAGEYIEIRLDLVNGLAGELHTTGWQLEEGSVATPFEQRPYGLELSLCQYFLRPIYVAVQNQVTTTSGQNTTQNLYFPSMRTTPTVINQSVVYAGSINSSGVASVTKNSIQYEFYYGALNSLGACVRTDLLSAEL